MPSKKDNLNQDRFPSSGIEHGKTLDDVIHAMIKDESIPINDIGTIILEPGVKKHKRFKYRNEKDRELNLEVFSSIPGVIEIETTSLVLPYK